MRKQFISLSLFLALVSGSLQVASQTVSAISGPFILDLKKPVVSVLYPDGGEVLEQGTSMLVKWTASDDNLASHPIAIQLVSVPSGEVFTLAQAIGNTGSHQVIVPAMSHSQARLRITARDGFGNTGIAESKSPFTLTESSTGIDELQTEDGSLMKVFPNPARESVYVRFTQNGPGPAAVFLVTLAGQTIHFRQVDQQGQVSVNLSTSGLPSGLYLIRLETGSGISTEKVLIR
jgi:hypothetical protein